MGGDHFTYLAKQALTLSVVLCLPAIIVAAVVGLLFSIFQTLTQIQDQTLSFAIKLLFTLAAIYMSLNWASSEIYRFTLMLYEYKW